MRSTRSACTPTSRRSNGTTRAPMSRAGSLLARRALGACARSRWSAAATLTSRWSTTSGISWIASELIDERRGPRAKSARLRGHLSVYIRSRMRLTNIRGHCAAAPAARTCLSPRLAIRSPNVARAVCHVMGSYGDVRVKDKWREMCDYMILLLIRSTNDNRGDIVGTRDVAHMGARAPWSRSGGPGGVGPQSHLP